MGTDLGMHSWEFEEEILNMYSALVSDFGGGSGTMQTPSSKWMWRQILWLHEANLIPVIEREGFPPL
jgi:hypothetical protein